MLRIFISEYTLFFTGTLHIKLDILRVYSLPRKQYGGRGVTHSFTNRIIKLRRPHALHKPTTTWFISRGTFHQIYGCYNSKPDNLGSTIIKLLGGFRKNLLILSWVTPTPGCTAKFNFRGNRYSQPLILRPSGRSGQELPVEYQVEPFFMNFSMSTS